MNEIVADKHFYQSRLSQNCTSLTIKWVYTRQSTHTIGIRGSQNKKESLIDGCYIVFIDVSVGDLSAAETVKSYKDLFKVKQAFRSLKTTALEIGPVYHKTDERIKCHVFICKKMR